jgi:hypothetical protein
MKRILLACFLLTATVAATVSTTPAQASASVSVTTFTAKVNLMDSYIAAGNMTAAQTTWDEINGLMISALGDSKASIAGASTPAAATTATNVMNGQYNLYTQIWALKSDLATNRATIHTKLLDFSATL